MKKIVFNVCCLTIGIVFNTYAQIDLGVDDLSLDTGDEDVKMEISTDNSTANTKSFSFFDKALNIIGISEPEKENATISIDELKTKAAQGDITAQLDLGYMYLYGLNGLDIDYKQALDYYQTAAEKNSAAAYNNLGSLYFNGIGVDVDYAKAITYFDKAAALGSDDAAVNLAIIYLGSDTKNKTQKDLDKALQLLIQAEKNNNIAKYILGYSYLKGFLVKKDYNKAFAMIKAAADDNYDEAQLVLSDFYINGWSTPKNYNLAVKYLTKASEQGNAGAMSKLGDIYSEGKIYTRDIKKAHIQYNLASVFGQKSAAQKRDDLETKIKIEDLLSVQAAAEDYKPQPSQQTAFIRQTYGDSLKAYVDLNFKRLNKTISGSKQEK